MLSRSNDSSVEHEMRTYPSGRRTSSAPRIISIKNGFEESSTTTPTTFDRAPRSCRAAVLRTNPVSRMAASTRSLVASDTTLGSFKTFETVPRATPARSATSRMVTRRAVEPGEIDGDVLCSGSSLTVDSAPLWSRRFHCATLGMATGELGLPSRYRTLRTPDKTYARCSVQARSEERSLSETVRPLLRGKSFRIGRFCTGFLTNVIDSAWEVFYSDDSRN